MKGLWWILCCCMALVAQPTKALATDPPTCQLNNKNGVVHQTLCYGETVKIKATSSNENATLQWYRQHNGGSGWVAVTGATQSELTTGPGLYKAIFTFGDNSTCETETDTIDNWNAYQIDWNVAACRAEIASMTPIPFPIQSIGNQEMATPIDLSDNDEISYGWQVIPAPVQASFSTSSTSIFPLADGFFQDTTLGLHQVILTVSQQGCSCISVDTMEVTLLPLHLWTDTILNFNQIPTLAMVQVVGGTEPSTIQWMNANCFNEPVCDTALISTFTNPISVKVSDAVGCTNEIEIPILIAPAPVITLPESIKGFSILAFDSLKANGLIGVDGKVGYQTFYGQGQIQIHADSLVDSVQVNLPDISAMVSAFKTQLNNLHPICTNCPLSGTYSPGVRNYAGNLILADSLVFEGRWNDQFIFNIAGDLTIESSGHILYHTNSPANIIWNVGGKVLIEEGATFRGTVLANGEIEVHPGNSFYSRFISQGNIDVDQADSGRFILFSTNRKTASVSLSSNSTIPCSGGAMGILYNPSFECGGKMVFVPGNGETEPITYYDPCGKFVNQWNAIYSSANSWNYFKDGYLNPLPSNVHPCYSLAFFQPGSGAPKYVKGFGATGSNHGAYIGLNLYTQNSNGDIFMNYFQQKLHVPAKKGIYFGRLKLAPHPQAMIGLEASRSIGIFLSAAQPMDFSGIVSGTNCQSLQNNNLPKCLVLNQGPNADCPYTEINPQIKVQNNGQLQGPNLWNSSSPAPNWTNIESFFDLEEEAQYVTIGAFALHKMNTIGGPLLDEEQPVNGATIGMMNPATKNNYKWQYLFDGIEIIPIATEPSQTQQICPGETVWIGPEQNQAAFGISYTWSHNPALTWQRIQVSPMVSTNYILNVHFNGQTKSITYFIEVGLPHGYNAGNPGPLTLCNSTSISLQPSWTFQSPGSWFIKKNGTTQAISSPITANQLTQGFGQYDLFFVETGGCHFETISLNYYPETVAGSAITLCRTMGTHPSDGIPLTTGTPAGGTWSGPGVWNNSFFSSLLNPEVSQVTLTYSAPCGSADLLVTVLDCRGKVKSDCGNVRKLLFSSSFTPSQIKWVRNSDLAVVSTSDFYVVPSGITDDFTVEATYGDQVLYTHFSVWENHNFNEEMAFDGTHFLYGNSNFNNIIDLPAGSYMENHGEIIMTANARFTIAGNLVNGPFAFISCISLSKFTLRQTGILEARNCPNEFWGGVILDPHAEFYAHPASTIRHMRDGIRSQNNWVQGDIFPTRVEADGAIFEDNYHCFQFSLGSTGFIRNNTVSYSGSRRFQADWCTTLNPPEVGSCNEFGFSFISIFYPVNFTATLPIENNTISRYVTGIYLLHDPQSSIPATITLTSNSFLGYNRAINLRSKANLTIVNNEFNPAYTGEGNYGQYRTLTNEPIGPMFIEQNSFAGVYSTGINSNITAIGNNRFIGFNRNGFYQRDYGFYIGGSNHQLTINENLFSNPALGVHIQSGTHVMNSFRCNRFEVTPGDNTLRIGLHIGWEPNNPTTATPAGALSGPIGGNGSFPNPPPNANIWPQWPNNPGHSPDGWTSIKKYDGGGPMVYFKFTNEFVGNILPITGANLVDLQSHRIARSPRAVLDWCTQNHPGDPNCLGQADTYPDWPSNWNAVCGNLDDETDYFPLRPALGSTMTANANLEQVKPALGDPIPNPAAGKTYVPVFWTKVKGTLVVFELTSGKEICRKPVLKGQQMVELDIQQWSAGVYGYRLEGECPCPEPKRLVVIH